MNVIWKYQSSMVALNESNIILSLSESTFIHSSKLQTDLPRVE